MHDSWLTLGAAFGPVMILALYWRRFNFWGAAASIVAGAGVATFRWRLDGGPSGMWDIQPATPGFLIAVVVAVAVSLLTPKPSGEVVALFDKVNAERA